MFKHIVKYPLSNVSPYRGEWIEISIVSECTMIMSVSPYIGEWIEIGSGSSRMFSLARLTLHR